MMAGGLTESKPSDAEVEKIVNDLKPQIEEKTGKTYAELTVHSYKTQVVAGANYFVKVKTGEEFLHARIYQHFSGKTTLHSIQEGKSEQEDIVYF